MSQNNQSPIKLSKLLQKDKSAQNITANILRNIGIAYTPFNAVEDKQLKEQANPSKLQSQVKPKIDSFTPFVQEKTQQIVKAEVEEIQQRVHMRQNNRLEAIKEEIKNQIEAEKKLKMQEMKMKQEMERIASEERQRQEMIKNSMKLDVENARVKERESKLQLYIKTKNFVIKFKFYQIMQKRFKLIQGKEQQLKMQFCQHHKKQVLCSIQRKVQDILKMKQIQQKQLQEELELKKLCESEDFYKHILMSHSFRTLIKETKRRVLQQQALKQEVIQKQKIEDFLQRQMQSQLVEKQVDKSQVSSSQRDTYPMKQSQQQSQQQNEAEKSQSRPENLRQANKKKVIGKIQPQPQQQPQQLQQSQTQQPQAKEKQKESPATQKQNAFLQQMNEREEKRMKLKEQKEESKKKKDEEKNEAAKQQEQLQKQHLLEIMFKSETFQEKLLKRIAFQKLIRKTQLLKKQFMQNKQKQNKKILKQALNQMQLATKLQEQKEEQLFKSLSAIFQRAQLRIYRISFYSKLKQQLSQTRQKVNKIQQYQQQNAQRSCLYAINALVKLRQEDENIIVNQYSNQIKKKTVLHMFKFNCQQSKNEKQRKFRINKYMEEFNTYLEENDYTLKMNIALDEKFQQIYTRQQPNIPIYFEAERAWGLKGPTWNQYGNVERE